MDLRPPSKTLAQLLSSHSRLKALDIVRYQNSEMIFWKRPKRINNDMRMKAYIIFN